MEINTHNYEQYLVDYLEGNLSETLRNQVKAFLIANPNIQEELNLYNSIKLEATANLKTKDFLKRIPQNKTTENSNYFQNLCIGNIEDENTTDENQLLEILIHKSEKKHNTLNLFKKTKLKIESFNFDEKILIKKDPIAHQINDNNFEEYCVAKTEKWLDLHGEQNLKKYLRQNPLKQSTFELYKKLKLVPDHQIVFKNKKALKKSHIINETAKKRLAYISGIAAISLFMFMVYNTYKLEDENNLNNQAAYSNQRKEKSEIIETKIHIPELKSENTKNIYKKKNAETSQNNKPINKIFHPIKKQKETLAYIKPIKIFQIECSKCITYNETEKYFKTDIPNASLANLGSQISSKNTAINNDELAWKLAQASISGINKLTNADIALKRKKTNEKTKIGFNSKYFSFSAPIKNK